MKKTVSSLIALWCTCSLALLAQDADLPANVGSDGGVEAVREAQECPIPGADAGTEFVSASTVLHTLANDKGWFEGWDEEKDRIIVVTQAEFISKNPTTDKTFFTRRELAAKRAVLQAKVKIIQTINQQMSAEDQMEMPGTDVSAALGAEKAQLDEAMAMQAQELADLLENLDKAKADEMRGVTFGDRMNALFDACIKKLDDSYSKENIEKEKKEKLEKVKQEYVACKQKYDELKKKAENMKAELSAKQTSSVECMAKMPLYGSTVIMQTESWDKTTGTAEVAVMLCWSKDMERSARAIVTGEDFKLKPKANGLKVQEWLAKQNPAVMVGPRQYVDKNGNRWFLAITSRPCIGTPTQKRSAKGSAEMFAQQMAAFCIWADVESYKQAKQAMETYTKGAGENAEDIDVVASSYAEKLSQSFKNKTIRGMQQLFAREMKHPITGINTYVVVYGINSASAAKALEIEKINYATKVMDNQHQTVERGRRAANEAAVKASENRKEDFQKGYNEQTNRLNQELQKRADEQKSARKGVQITNGGSKQQGEAKAQSGAFGGDADVDDDF